VRTAVVLIAVVFAAACGSGQHAATTTTTSELYGTITAGPSCPVEQVGNPCPPRPVSARVEIRNASSRVVAATTSGRDGRYSVRVPAGPYTVVVVTATMPSCPPQPVQARANAAVKADITCDSGIR
jgi:Carboxypeptidase regulatory-like domain